MDSQSPSTSQELDRPSSTPVLESSTVSKSLQSSHAPQQATGAIPKNLKGKKRKKLLKENEEKAKRKDPTHWDQTLESIQSLNHNESMKIIERNYKELYELIRKQSEELKRRDHRINDLQFDRVMNQAEMEKVRSANERLESLCRELQKHNKLIKDENMARIAEEEARRKAMSATFEGKLKEVAAMMEENKDKNDQLATENQKQNQRMSEIYQHFKSREEVIGKMSNEANLERQRTKTAMKKFELQLKLEKEIHEKERTMLLENLQKSESNNLILKEANKKLEEHLMIYKSQYADFEKTMEKSNVIFDSMKQEMSTMTKQTSVLEKEVQVWKAKFYDSTRAIIEFSQMKFNQDEQLEKANRRISQLEKLCRKLQSDRTSYLKQMKSHGIEPCKEESEEEESELDLPSIAPAHERAPPIIQTAKELELQKLKTTLKEVQEKLESVTISSETEAKRKCTEESLQESQVQDIDINVTEINSKDVTIIGDKTLKRKSIEPLQESEIQANDINSTEINSNGNDS